MEAAPSCSRVCEPYFCFNLDSKAAIGMQNLNPIKQGSIMQTRDSDNRHAPSAHSREALERIIDERILHLHESSAHHGDAERSEEDRDPKRRSTLHMGARLSAAALAGGVVAVSFYAYADILGEPPVARLLPYEGVLELDGQPVNGVVDFEFSLYSSTADDAAVLWNETQSEVEVVQGRFAVVLGQQSANPLPRAVHESPELYLGMAINDLPMSNRQRIVAGTSSVITAHTTPVGAVMAFAGQEPPRGWLMCDGSSVSRTTYPALFEAIGTTHGNGENASSFQLPDYRGRFLRGVDDGAGRDPNAAQRQAAQPGGLTGDQVGSIQGGSTALPNTNFTTGNNNRGHTHTFEVYRASFGSGGAPAALFRGHPFGENRQTANENQPHTHTVLSGGDAETRPVNVGVHWIIKY